MKEFLPFWPQIFVIGFLTLTTLRDWLLAGTERQYTFRPAHSIIFQCFYIWVSVQGGFFNSWSFPQYIYIFIQILVFIVIIYAIAKVDKDKKINKLHETSTISSLLIFGLYYWGGFFDKFFEFLMR